MFNKQVKSSNYYKLINIYYYLYFSSDNSDIAIRIQKVADKHEESGSKIIVRKTVCTENVLDNPYDNKNLSESSISSFMCCSNSNDLYYDSVDTSGKNY